MPDSHARRIQQNEFSIAALDLRDDGVLADAHRICHAAYSVEAQLLLQWLEPQSFPPLAVHARQLRELEYSFLCAHQGGQLRGLLGAEDLRPAGELCIAALATYQRLGFRTHRTFTVGAPALPMLELRWHSIRA